MRIRFNTAYNKWDKVRWFQLRFGRYNIVLYAHGRTAYHGPHLKFKVYDNIYWS